MRNARVTPSYKCLNRCAWSDGVDVMSLVRQNVSEPARVQQLHRCKRPIFNCGRDGHGPVLRDGRRLVDSGYPGRNAAAPTEAVEHTLAWYEASIDASLNVDHRESQMFAATVMTDS